MLPEAHRQEAEQLNCDIEKTGTDPLPIERYVFVPARSIYLCLRDFRGSPSRLGEQAKKGEATEKKVWLWERKDFGNELTHCTNRRNKWSSGILNRRSEPGHPH